MTISTCSEPMMRSEKAVRTCALSEIVRGSEGCLVMEMEPLVRRQDVSLDLSPVERIDAAGIAALITLYKLATGVRAQIHGVECGPAGIRVIGTSWTRIDPYFS